MASNIRITGLRETVRSLEKFGAEASDLKEVFTRVGNLVVNEARQLVRKKSGALTSSIRPSKSKNKALIRAGSAGVPYAGVQHWGGYNNISPNLFLTKAVGAKQGQALNEMEKGLNGLIRRLDLN